MVEGRKAEGDKESPHRRAEHKNASEGRAETVHPERSLETDPKDLGKTPSKLYELASQGMEELTSSGRFRQLGHEIAKGFLDFEHSAEGALKKLFHSGDQKADHGGKDGKDNKDNVGLKDAKDQPKTAFGLEPIQQGFNPAVHSENVKIVSVKILHNGEKQPATELNTDPQKIAAPGAEKQDKTPAEKRDGATGDKQDAARTEKPDAIQPNAVDPLQPKKVGTISIKSTSNETFGNTPILSTDSFAGPVDMNNVQILKVKNVNLDLKQPEKTPLQPGPCDLNSAPDALKPISFEQFQKSLNISAPTTVTDAAQVQQQQYDPCVLNSKTPPLTMANMQASLRGEPLPDRTVPQPQPVDQRDPCVLNPSAPPLTMANMQAALRGEPLPDRAAPPAQPDAPPPAVPSSVMFNPTPIAQQQIPLDTQAKPPDAQQPANPAALDPVLFNPTPIANQHIQTPERRTGSGPAPGPATVAQVGGGFPAGGTADSRRSAADNCVLDPHAPPLTLDAVRGSLYGTNPPPNPVESKAASPTSNPLSTVPGDATAGQNQQGMRPPTDVTGNAQTQSAGGTGSAGGERESSRRSGGGGGESSGGTHSSSSGRSSERSSTGTDVPPIASSRNFGDTDDKRWNVGMNINSRNDAANSRGTDYSVAAKAQSSLSDGQQSQYSRTLAANAESSAAKNQDSVNNKTSESFVANSMRAESEKQLAEQVKSQTAARQEQISATNEQVKAQREVEEKKRVWEADQNKWNVGPGNSAKGDAANSSQKAAESLNLSMAAALARASFPVSGAVSLDSLAVGNAGKGSGDKASTAGGDGIHGPVALSALKSSSAGSDSVMSSNSRSIGSSDLSAGANTGTGRSFFGDASKGLAGEASSVLAGGKGIFALDQHSASKSAALDALVSGKLNGLDAAGKNIALDASMGTRGLPNNNSAISLHGNKDFMVDAQGRVTRIDPITGRVIVVEGAKASDFQLSQLVKLQGTVGNKRYLTGVEIAIAAAIASVAIAKKRPNQFDDLGDGQFAASDMKNLLTEAELGAKDQQNDSEDKDSSNSSNNQTANLFKRPTMIVAHNDSLVEIAEKLFHDSDVAWLIADINRNAITEHEEDGKRIIELRSRQEIQLPLPSEVQEFLMNKSKDAVSSKLVTIVTVSEIDRELLNSFLSTVVGTSSTEDEPVREPALVGASAEVEKAAPAVLFPSAKPAFMELMTLSKHIGNTFMPTMNAIKQQGRSLATYISKIDQLLPPPPAVHVFKPEIQP